MKKNNGKYQSVIGLIFGDNVLKFNKPIRIRIDDNVKGIVVLKEK